MTKPKNPDEKKRPGRKTPFKEEFIGLALNYALLGATDVEMADFFGVSEKTLNTWKKQHPEFLQSLKKGKFQADSIVASKLFHRAKGYSHPDVHITNYKGDITKTNITKYYPPDTLAAIFWLKNRQPEKWRERIENKLSGDLDINLKDSQVNYKELEEKLFSLVDKLKAGE